METVCICEDDVIVRMVAVELLSEEGFRVVDFPTGDDALAYLHERADAVLMIFTDIHMPGEHNGIHLAHIAAARWPWIKLLITSALSPVAALPPHAKFLRKPWRHADVVAHARH